MENSAEQTRYRFSCQNEATRQSRRFSGSEWRVALKRFVFDNFKSAGIMCSASDVVPVVCCAGVGDHKH